MKRYCFKSSVACISRVLVGGFLDRLKGGELSRPPLISGSKYYHTTAAIGVRHIAFFIQHVASGPVRLVRALVL